MKRVIVFFAAATLFISCGSIMDGLASMYGGGYGRGYNPYADFWNNASTSATTVPAALDPVNAANAAAATMNANLQNQMKDYWENAAKDEQQRQKMAEAYAKDAWEHPEKYQNVPVQSGNGVGRSTVSGTVSGNNSSGMSGQQCRVCGGTGRKISLVHPGDATQTKWYSECNKTVGTGHFHTQCDNCRGTGRIQ